MAAEQYYLQALLKNDERLRRFFLPNVRRTGREVGRGAYGSVDELEMNGIVCAGKAIYDAIFHERSITKYVEECQLMSDLRHPHVVQFLGIAFLPPSPLPLLVMELLHQSLDKLLSDHAHHPPLLTGTDIPLALKKSFFLDIARGLYFLHHHSPDPVIHRDLSATNVLLTRSMKAKISDLGNSRRVSHEMGRQALSLGIPGNPLYMPPEAHLTPPRHGPEMDIFSLGHIMLYTLIQIFPCELLEVTYPDPTAPGRLLARSEVERRVNYITQLHCHLGVGHPLVRLVTQCLSNTPEDRPTVGDLLHQLEEMAIEDRYKDMTRLDLIEQVEEREGEVRQTMEESRQKDIELQERDDRLQQLERETEQNQQIIRETEIQRREMELREKNDELQRLRPQVQQQHVTSVQHQLTAVTEDRDALQQVLVTKDTELSVVRERLHTTEEALRVKEMEITANNSLLRLQSGPEQLNVLPIHPPLTSHQCAQLPVGMFNAQAIQLNDKIYVQGDTGLRDADSNIYTYDTPTDTWQFICSPAYWSALTIYNSQLVLVGGRLADTSTNTNQLWTLEDDSSWHQPIPPMIIKRYSPSAINSGHYLVVAGGETGIFKPTNTVEVYNGHQWVAADPLPIASYYIKSTYHSGTWYLMGGYSKSKSKSKYVMYTSLQALIHKATQDPPHTTQQKSLWKHLPDVPYRCSSTATLAGTLLAVGGVDIKSGKRMSEIHMYCHMTQSWLCIGELPQVLDSTCCTTLSTGEVMVIGGWTGIYTSSVFHKLSLRLQ